MTLDGDYKVDVGNRPEGTSTATLNRILGGKNIRIDPDESIDVHEKQYSLSHVFGLFDGT